MPQYDPVTQESAGENSPTLYEMLRRGRSFSGHERHCCYLNTGQTRFANISAASGFDYPDDGRSISLVDWDLDGDLDLWLVNRNGPQVRFLRNDIPRDHHYLAFRLVGTTGNRDAIGARVALVFEDPRAAGGDSLTTLIKTLRAGDGYLAQSSKWMQFGLGKATAVKRLSVRWPDGSEEQFEFDASGAPAMVDTRYELVQGTGIARTWQQPERTVAWTSTRLDSPPLSDVAQILMVYPVPLPTLEYTTFDARPVSIAAELPRPVLVTLWASWCGPCLDELHQFTVRQGDIQQAGLDVIALSADALEADPAGVEQARELLSKVGFPHATGLATEALVDRLQMIHDVLFDFHGDMPVPTSFLIDTQRHLCAIYKGPVQVDQVLADLPRLQLKGEELRQASVPFSGRWLGRQPGHRFLRIAANILEAGRPDEAADYLLRFERYFGHSPAYADVASQVGVALATQGQDAQAAELFLRAQRLKPDVTSTRFYLAQSLERLGRPQEALEHYRNVIALDPRSVNGHFRIGLLLAATGQLQEALPHFQKTVELRPAWADARLKLAIALLHLDRPDEALVHFNEAIRQQPKDPATQIQLAWTLATHPDSRFRNGPEAIRWAEAGCKATRYSIAQALDALAAAQAEAGQFEQAASTAQRAVDMAQSAKQDRLAESITARLRQYQNHRPFRDQAN